MGLLISILGWTIFVLAIIAGIGLNLLGLFGNWVILGAIGVAALVSGFTHFGGYTLPILLGFAILGEVLETGAAGVGAARFGGGKGAIGSSLIGCILGAILFTPLIPIPIVGTLIGGCIGAFLGGGMYEYLQREKSVRESVQVGFGAALGKIGGVMAKSVIGFIMLLIALFTF